MELLCELLSNTVNTKLYLCGDYVDVCFCLLLSAGELEKQQGSKAHSVKNNGTQLELRGKQGSPSGVCVYTAAFSF